MKKLLCILFPLFPVVVYSQSDYRQAAEKQVRDYYQSIIEQKKKELKEAQIDLAKYVRLPDYEFDEEKKADAVYLSLKIKNLEAEIKGIEEEFNDKLKALQPGSQTAKPVQTQKNGQRKNTARRKSNTNSQANAPRKTGTQNAAVTQQKKNVASKDEGGQTETRQFNQRKAVYMSDSKPYYDAQKNKADRTASHVAVGEMEARASNEAIHITQNDISPAKPKNEVHSNRLNNVSKKQNINQQANHGAFEKGLTFREQVNALQYDESWPLRCKIEAVNSWLALSNSSADGEAATEEDDPRMKERWAENLNKKLVDGLKSVAQDAAGDSKKFVEAQSMGEGQQVMAEQYYKLGAGPSQRQVESHFWSQIGDSKKQSQIIDVLVRQCKDGDGKVIPDALGRVVKAVDSGVELMKKGQSLEGGDELTRRANEVLNTFRGMCSNGLCKKE